jgi:hypothetical protein
VRLASDSSRYTESIYQTEKLVGPKTSMDVLAKKETLPLPEINFWYPAILLSHLKA